MKTIRHFHNVAEASFARSLLESAGIDAALADELAFALEPPLAPWGIRLQVPEEDAERALAILAGRAKFTPLPPNFVPPREPIVLAPVLPEQPESKSSAFIWGGVRALSVVGICVLFALAGGEKVRVDFSIILLVFLLGGTVGLVLRGNYRRGKWEEAPDESA